MTLEPPARHHLVLPPAILPIVLVLALVTACAGDRQPPPGVEALAAAGAALDQAEIAGAGTWAAIELGAAQAKLEAAHAAAAAGDHRLARLLAEQAAIDAELAEAKSRAEMLQHAAATLRAGRPLPPGGMQSPLIAIGASTP